MPLQFAIFERIPEKDTEEGEHLNSYNSTRIYHPAPQAVAEIHEYGVVSIITNAGKQITPWIEMDFYFWKDAVKKSEKTGNSKIQFKEDMLGEKLVAGDYVVVGTANSAELTLGKVVSFTPKMINVMTYGNHPAVSPKNSLSVAKVQPHILNNAKITRGL